MQLVVHSGLTNQLYNADLQTQACHITKWGLEHDAIVFLQSPDDVVTLAYITVHRLSARACKCLLSHIQAKHLTSYDQSFADRLSMTSHNGSALTYCLVSSYNQNADERAVDFGDRPQSHGCYLINLTHATFRQTWNPNETRIRKATCMQHIAQHRHTWL